MSQTEVGRMQASVRAWVLRTASGGARGLRDMPPGMLLGLLTASALAPVFTAVAGLGGLVVVAGNVLSSVGGGVLSGIITEVVQREHTRDAADGSSPGEPDALQRQVAAEIGRVLAAGDANAGVLRTEIATVLSRVDVGGTALRAAMEEGNELLRRDVIGALGALGTDFSELSFLINDVAAAAAEIQRGLDEQGSDIRAIREQNQRQSADIRIVRDDVAVLARRTGARVPARDAGDAGAPRWVRGCPYRGLLPFEESDADVFYGRERLTAELTVQLAAQLTPGGLIVVTGASGAGKSSLLRAGLLPKLNQGQQVPGSEHWPRIVMTPTKDPLTELAARLAALGGTDTIAIRDGLARNPDQAHLAVWQAVLADAAWRRSGQQASDGSDARLVLIIDQFEQVFTLSAGEADRRAFIGALRAASYAPVGPRGQPPALVVIAVRGDFWDRCAAYPELADALQEGQFVVGPMTESELRLAITGPADAAGLRIDQALTETILGDLRAAGGDAAGTLPLLSQAMALTWDHREGSRLTSHGYGQAGGVGRAVQNSADSAYDKLTAGRQQIAREVLCNMTVAGRDGRLTRRPVTRAELYGALAGTSQSDIDAVLEAFAAERLIILDVGNAQISHDVLLRAWPRLRGWLQDDQASWILHGKLADDAAGWHENDDDPSFLYRGTHLAAVRQAVGRWAANPARYPALTTVQHDFLRVSELAAARSRRLLRAAVAALAALALVASTAFGFAFVFGNDATQQRDQAIFNQTSAEGLQLAATDTPLAAQLDLAAYRMQPTEDLYSRLISTENTPLSSSVDGGAGAAGGPVDSVAFGRALSGGGYLMATASYYGTLRLWDVTGPGQARLLNQPMTGGRSDYTVSSLAFSPDGRTLSAAYNGTIRLWDVTDPAAPRATGTIKIPDGANANSLAFSSVADVLASGETGGTLELWDVTDPASPRRLGVPLTASADNTGVDQVAFSPDGRTLAAAADDGTIRFWDVAEPASPRPLGQPVTGGAGPVDSIAFSPDGRMLASGDYDDTVRLWNVANPASPRPIGQPLTANTDEVSSVAFSPDGGILASGDYDDTVRLWDIANPASPQLMSQPLTANTGTVFSVAFSPDGHTLASGNEDGTIRLWSLPPTLLTGPGGAVNSLALSPTGGSWPRAAPTVRSGYGTPPIRPTRGHSVRHWSPVLAMSPRWPSAPMAACSRRAAARCCRATTRWCRAAAAGSGCGMSATPTTPGRWARR
jgi:WD40 repeat protein/energy-coupling factor transporter ATP-binding protein EcfA2